ncbi:MAG: HD domain-containing protein [Nanoarchaeota archaeon]
MEPSSIISNIHDIYERYHIPLHLQEHMLRVASVGRCICEHWTGPMIDKDMIAASLLLHDMGNIVKFDFGSDFNKEMLGDDEKEIARWKQIQQDTIRRFGDRSHHVNIAIAKDLGVPVRIIELIDSIGFFNAPENAYSLDWEAKIVNYADERVAPWGVVSLKERLGDLTKRYGPKHPEVSPEEIRRTHEAMYGIEDEIAHLTGIPLSDINDGLIAPFLAELRPS